MEAALIYNVIFTFHLVVLSFIARMSSGLQMKLTTASLLKVRLAVPAFFYIWFSLWYTLVNRAFEVPLSNIVGDGGFVVFWALNYVTYMAIGLALEAFISLLTIRWFPFSLITWIILNITASFLPIPLMDPFYRWGRAFPFRLNVEATKIILYGTQPNHVLGQYFGGLIAWTVAGLFFVTAFQLLERWRTERGIKKAKAAEYNKEREADEDGGGEGGGDKSSSSNQHEEHHSTSTPSREDEPMASPPITVGTPGERYYEAQTPGAFGLNAEREGRSGMFD
jgi:hypothetical protein